MDGFFQRLLLIDLSNQTSKVEPIEESTLRQYLGGKGIGTHLLLERNSIGVDPLAPEAHFILALGPTSDSRFYGSCRYGIFAKSPLTGLYGESYSGGSVAIPMSRTGYDAFIFKGKSPHPVWLEITDSGINFNSAEDLWGMDTFLTEKEIRNKVPSKKAGVLAIGPAGENLVRFAVVKNDGWRVAGRTGMGAVLGSKNIKAIAFHGEQVRSVADFVGVKTYARTMLNNLKDHPAAIAFREKGTPMMVQILNEARAFPTRYWTESYHDQWERIGAQAMAKQMEVKPMACRTCFMACGKMVQVRQGRHKGLKIEGPEYETIYAFGGLCLVNEIEEIVYLNDLCDRLGIDTISGGNICAFAIEASKSGKIKKSLEYSNPKQIAQLLTDISYRQGIGNLLADGIRPASEELGLEDIAVHVKGMEPAGYDPRALKGMGLAYAVSDRGACHLRGTFYKAELAGLVDINDTSEVAKVFIDFEERAVLNDCMILCRFYRDFYEWEDLSNIIELTVGIKFDKAELRLIASRIIDETRLFNIREGMKMEEDWLPERFFKENLKDGSSISKDYMHTLIKNYYKLRNWNENGVPIH